MPSKFHVVYSIYIYYRCIYHISSLLSRPDSERTAYDLLDIFLTEVLRCIEMYHYPLAHLQNIDVPTGFGTIFSGKTYVHESENLMEGLQQCDLFRFTKI